MFKRKREKKKRHTRTVAWLSAAVLKIWDFLAGMTVPLGMSFVKTACGEIRMRNVI